MTFRMAFHALKHRYVAKVDGMLKRLISLVAGLAFAIGQPAQVDRVLNRHNLERS